MSGWQALNHPVAAVVLALAVVAALVLFMWAALIFFGLCLVGYAGQRGWRALQRHRRTEGHS
jgi:hypothetical protein